ncbi:MAG: ATP synthase F1 subunit gamma [Clostridia bacterium]|nr:ATP synthase F1 subunit gamma [Clostridia bacterium]
MENASEIKSRINSISETKKVTDAMYMISSVKMRKAKRGVENTRPYFEALKEEISELIANIPKNSNRYFHIPEPGKGRRKKHGILLITSDKGLAGAYNITAIRTAEEYMSRHPEIRLFIIGEYGRQYFAGKRIKYEEDFQYPSSFPSVYGSELICADLLEYFNDGRLDEIDIIYTDHQSGRQPECIRRCLLPLERSRFDIQAEGPVDPFKEYIPDPNTVLNGIIPGYLTGFIYSSLVDSYCSEQEARMSAMNTAGKNAEEMLKKLKTEYNRIRQAAITREMTEITSGARALKATRGDTGTEAILP